MQHGQQGSRWNYRPSNDSSSLSKKWSLVKYASLSTSLTFYNGGSATILSVPIGLQLNRRLNNNLYAFAGISAAPAYINFNRPFNAGSQKINANNYFTNGNNFDIYSWAELGLMYVNDQKTFSISGSIGVERNNYPTFYPTGRSHQQPRNVAR